MSVKTDVIFLGAGASVSAGFPTNVGLTRYLIEELPIRQRCTTVPRGPLSSDTVEQQWRFEAETLRKANCLSVDEFCELAQPSRGDGLTLKKMLSLALFDKVKDFKRWNDYVKLVDTLFIPRNVNLDDRLTLVNFNYDGLLGKMLVDAVRHRCKVAKKECPPGWRLAAIGGGWCGSGHGHDATPANHSAELQVPEFCHHMPHGTFTAAMNERDEILALEDLIYSDAADHSAKENWLLRHYDLIPMIQFPWERDNRRQIHQRQLVHPAHSVAEATRIHFIGLSGHHLLRHSLRDIFSSIDSTEELAKKQWFVATSEPNYERTFNRLLNCLLPDDWLNDDSLKARLRREMQHFGTFGEWLDVSPHLLG